MRLFSFRSFSGSGVPSTTKRKPRSRNMLAGLLGGTFAAVMTTAAVAQNTASFHQPPDKWESLPQAPSNTASPPELPNTWESLSQAPSDTASFPKAPSDPGAVPWLQSGTAPRAQSGIAPSAAAALPAMPQQSFLVGYNEAWFGSSFGTDYTANFDISYVLYTLDGIKANGGNLVRLFLFEVPQGYSLGPTVPQSGPISGQFLTNLETVLNEARARGIWVYLTLFDANTIRNVTGPLHTYGVNLINNIGGEADAFNANVLAPLLDMLNRHGDVVWGIDIINEIQAAYKANLFFDSWSWPRLFILREVQFIKARAPWIRLTSSAGWPDAFYQTGAQYDIARGFYTGIGLDFYDLHEYSDSGTWGGATDVCNRAAADQRWVYMGEFGQLTKTTNDSIQLLATSYFLNNTRALWCFKGAFAWRFDASEAYWAYRRADGSFRPAAQPMIAFGGAP